MSWPQCKFWTFSRSGRVWSIKPGGPPTRDSIASECPYVTNCQLVFRQSGTKGGGGCWPKCSVNWFVSALQPCQHLHTPSPTHTHTHTHTHIYRHILAQAQYVRKFVSKKAKKYSKRKTVCIWFSFGNVLMLNLCWLLVCFVSTLLLCSVAIQAAAWFACVDLAWLDWNNWPCIVSSQTPTFPSFLPGALHMHHVCVCVCVCIYVFALMYDVCVCLCLCLFSSLCLNNKLQRGTYLSAGNCTPETYTRPAADRLLQEAYICTCRALQ